MKKLLAILTTVPFVATSCITMVPSDEPSTPSEPQTPDTPDTPEAPDNSFPATPIEPSIPVNPNPAPDDNEAPLFGKTSFTFGVHTDMSNLDWKTLLQLSDDTTATEDIYLMNYGLEHVYGVEKVVNVQFFASDEWGAERWQNVEITYQGLGLSDDQIFASANQMSFQITTNHTGRTYYGSGYALSMDETTGDMYVMTNMHVVPTAASTTLLKHDYGKVGSYLPALCADYEYTTSSRWNSSNYTDLSILKISGASTDGTINGCNNPTPYDIDTSLVEFPNLLEVNSLIDGDYYGYRQSGQFDNVAMDVYLSAFPASGWNGSYYDGFSTIPTLQNRKEVLRDRTYYMSTGGYNSSYQSTSLIGDGYRTYQNNVIRVLGDNITGGASGSIMLDRNLNVIGTVNAHDSTNQLTVMVAADEMRYFINKYCEDPTHSNINMCK